MFIVCICGRWNQTSNLLVSYSPLKQEEYAWLNYKLAYTPGGFKGLWNVYPKNLGRKGSNFFPSICPSIFWVRKNPPLRRIFWGQKMPPQAEEARQMVERWKATDVDVMSCWGCFFVTDCRSGVTSSALAADVENCMSKSIQPQLGMMMKLQVPLSPIPSMVASYFHLHQWLMFIYVYGKRYTWIRFSTTISG